MQLLRAWTNAFCTSHRMHESTLLPALCGCSGASVVQQHYFACRRLHILVADAFRCCAPASGALEALCLVPAERARAVGVYLLSTAYHGLRHSATTSVLAFIRDGNINQVLHVWAEQLFQAAVGLYNRRDIRRQLQEIVVSPFFPRVPRALRFAEQPALEPPVS